MIKVLIYGEAYHALAFTEQLKSYVNNMLQPKYIEDLSSEINYKDFDVFHLISPPLPVIKKLTKLGKPIIYHWIGTDVQRITRDFFIKRNAKKWLLKSSGVINLVVSKNLQRELEQIGIRSEVLPLVKLKFIETCPPLPEKLIVLTYIPKNRWDFYHGSLVLKLAEKLPDIDFHILAAGKIDVGLPNVHAYDFLSDMKSFYTKSSVLLRITNHDGLPKMVLEALSYGRHVLWSEPFPHCFKVKNYDDALKAIQLLKRSITLNIAGKKYVENQFHPQLISEKYLSLCKKIIAV